MRKFLLVFLLFPLVTIAQSNSEKITRIDSVLTYLHSRELFSGTVLIGEKGKVLFKKAYGISNPKTNTPLATTSSFNLASVSKQFYTMMTMILKEQGKLQYDDKVQKYLPIFPYPSITIRNLMNQTSGLPEYFDIAMRNMTLLDTLTNQHMLDLLAYKKPLLNFEPGERWQYCNTNYTTLASIVEKVSGTTADKFFQQSIAGPLKMINTYVYNIKMKSYPPSRVFGIKEEGGKHVLNDLVRLDGIVGDGNVYSSVEDLYKWDQALYTEKLVKKSTFQEALTPGKLNDGKSTQYGFGWFIEEPGKSVNHTGGWVAFNTIICRYIDKNQTVLVLDNSTNYRAPRMVKNIWEGKKIKLPKTLLIANVNLIDGTGLPAYATSVRVVNDRISDIGNLIPFKNEPITDGMGLILSPGFIDSHSHHDWGLDKFPDVVAATNQGVTTIVVGQDGGSYPIDTIKAALKIQPISVNLATYTGHATLRRMVMKQRLFRAARQSEIDSMKSILASEMDKGSFGLGSGLEYEAAFFSHTDEVIDLAKVAKSKGGRYISHIRSEDMSIDESIDEIIEIGRKADIPVQISHFKIAMRSKWGTSQRILAKLQQARTEGIDITADVYPYTRWMSTPRVLFPKKDFESPASALFATQELFDPSSSVMVEYYGHKEYEGKTVTEIGAMNNESPSAGLLRIIRETQKGGTIAAASMSETDISNFLNWDHTNVCSDGAIEGHPRGYGAFTRFLGVYVREQKLMPLEKAVYKMTGLTSEHLGIAERGIVTPGYFADLVLFNPATVIDNSTITNPKALSSGIEMVWVNGELVFQNQKATGKHPGVFVARP